MFKKLILSLLLVPAVLKPMDDILREAIKQPIGSGGKFVVMAYKIMPINTKNSFLEIMDDFDKAVILGCVAQYLYLLVQNSINSLPKDIENFDIVFDAQVKLTQSFLSSLSNKDKQNLFIGLTQLLSVVIFESIINNQAQAGILQAANFPSNLLIELDTIADSYLHAKDPKQKSNSLAKFVAFAENNYTALESKLTGKQKKVMKFWLEKFRSDLLLFLYAGKLI